LYQYQLILVSAPPSSALRDHKAPLCSAERLSLHLQCDKVHQEAGLERLCTAH
jgi:hypothetical protein